MRKKRKVLFGLLTALLALLCCIGFAAAEPGDEPASDESVVDQQDATGDADTTDTTDDAANDLPSDLSDIDLSTVPDIGQQGTDGDELSVTKTSHIEIYLGEEYRGLEFSLETDDGSYPDPVVADGEGRLSFDIGSGDHYTLRCTGNYDRSDSTQDGMVDANGEFADPFPAQETEKSSFPIWLIVLIAVTGILFVIYILRWFGIIDTKRKRRPKEAKEAQEQKQKKKAKPAAKAHSEDQDDDIIE